MKDILTIYYFAIRSTIKVFILILMLSFLLCVVIICSPFLWLGFVRKYLYKLGMVIQDVFEGRI